MYTKQLFRLKITGLTFLITIIVSHSAFAIGSGGILNLVPQARVWIEQSGIKQQMAVWRVYVHPIEGSLLVVTTGQEKFIALDKNKKHAIMIERSSVIFSDSNAIVDVPEETPYKVLKYRPHFNRTHANVLLDDGSLLIVDVER